MEKENINLSRIELYECNYLYSPSSVKKIVERQIIRGHKKLWITILHYFHITRAEQKAELFEYLDKINLEECRQIADKTNRLIIKRMVMKGDVPAWITRDENGLLEMIEKGIIKLI